MTEKAPLEAMCASRMVETKFQRDGEVTALWLAERAGRRHPMVPPEALAAEASLSESPPQ